MNQTLELLRSPTLGAVSLPGESERDFRIRLQQASRENRDAQVETLRQEYGAKIAALQERIRRAEQVVAREAEQARSHQLQTAVSFGATLLGAFLGRKALGSGTLGRATTAARGVSRSIDQSGDVGRAKESVQTLRQQLADLEVEFQDEVAELERRTDPLAETLETVAVKPKKRDIALHLVALGWVPYWQTAEDASTPAW